MEVKNLLVKFLPSFRSKRSWVFFVGGFFVFYIFLNFVSVWWASRSSYEGDSSAVIVLGAAQYNGEPSPALQGRLDTAGELYLEDKVDLVVVTGGGQENDRTTEAFTGYDYLSSGRFTIPESDLRLEVNGGSTYESIAASARFLKNEDKITDVILVTDSYHAKRAQLVANEVGLDAKVVLASDETTPARLIRESLAVSVGRVISFRRLERLGE